MDEPKGGLDRWAVSSGNGSVLYVEKALCKGVPGVCAAKMRLARGLIASMNPFRRCVGAVCGRRSAARLVLSDSRFVPARAAAAPLPAPLVSGFPSEADLTGGR